MGSWAEKNLEAGRKKAFGEGFVASEALRDWQLADRLRQYKSHVASGYRSLSPEQMKEVPFPARVSRKIDGEMWFLAYSEGAAVLLNPKGKALWGKIPVLEEAAAKMGRAFKEGLAIFAGELWRSKDGRERHGDLASLLAQGSGAEADALVFSAFDVLESPGHSAGNFEEKIALLEQTLGSSGLACAAPQLQVADLAALERLYGQTVVEGGAEGLVARSAQGSAWKIKPVHSVDAVVLGYTYSISEPDLARSLLIGLQEGSDRVRVLGTVGNLGADEFRKELMQKLRDLKAPSRVRFPSPGGSMYVFVEPKLVVEVNANDILAIKSDGEASRNAALKFADGEWVSEGLENMPSLVNPVLSRLRSDKDADDIEAPIRQIGDWLLPKAQAEEGAAPSSILRRQAWKKETKGKLAVRKLLVWKTNKEEADGVLEYPAYAVCWVDYSAGRAKPLEKTVRPASTEAKAMELAEALVAENIKKGWEPA